MPSLKNFKVSSGIEVNGAITANSISATTIDATLTGAALNSPTFTGVVTIPQLNVGPAGLSSTSIGNVTADEIEHLDGVTSNIQAQLDSKVSISELNTKAPTTNPSFKISDVEPTYFSPLYFSSLTAFHHISTPGDPSTLGIVINSAAMDIQMLNVTDPTKYKFRLTSDIEMGQILPAGDYPVNSITYPTTYTDGNGVEHTNATVMYINTDPFLPVSYLTTELAITQFTLVPIVKTISKTELLSLDGITSNIQTQLDSKASTTYVDNAVANVAGNIDLTEYAKKNNPEFIIKDTIATFMNGVDYSDLSVYYIQDGSLMLRVGGSPSVSSFLNSTFSNNNLANKELEITNSISPLPVGKYKITSSYGFDEHIGGIQAPHIVFETGSFTWTGGLGGNLYSDIPQFIINDSDKQISPQELLKINGVTSNIQQQLDSKQQQLDLKASKSYVDEVANTLMYPNTLISPNIVSGDGFYIPIHHPNLLASNYNSVTDYSYNPTNPLYSKAIAKKIKEFHFANFGGFGDYNYVTASLTVDEGIALNGGSQFITGTQNANVRVYDHSTPESPETYHITIRWTNYPYNPYAEINNAFIKFPNTKITSAKEIGYLDGVTSSIQTQLDSKVSTTELSNHESDTTDVHGIANTADLATKTYVDTAVANSGGSVDLTSYATKTDPTFFTTSYITLKVPIPMMAYGITNFGGAGNEAFKIPNSVSTPWYDLLPNAGPNIGTPVFFYGLTSSSTPIQLSMYKDTSTPSEKVLVFIGLDQYRDPTNNQFSINTRYPDLQKIVIGLPIATNLISEKELGYLDGLVDNIQDQLDLKLSSKSTALSKYATKIDPDFTIDTIPFDKSDVEYWIDGSAQKFKFTGKAYTEVISNMKPTTDPNLNHVYVLLGKGYHVYANYGLQIYVALDLSTDTGSKITGSSQSLNDINTNAPSQSGSTWDSSNPGIDLKLYLKDDALISSKELYYLDGLTSAIQPQLDNKASIAYVDNAIATGGTGGGGSVDLSNYVTKNTPVFNLTNNQTGFKYAGNNIFMLYPFEPGIDPLPNVGDIVTATNIVTSEVTTFEVLSASSSAISIINESGAPFVESMYDPKYNVTWTSLPSALSTITSKELSKLDGITSNIQQQINSKASINNIGSLIAQSGIGTWQTYSPIVTIPYDTFNIGDQGNANGKYTRIGNTVHFKLDIQIYGANASVGSLGNAWEISLPKPVKENETFDVGGSIRYGQVYRSVEFGKALGGSGSVAQFTPYLQNGTYASPLSHNTPQTMNVSGGNYVVISMYGTYECEQ